MVNNALLSLMYEMLYLLENNTMDRQFFRQMITKFKTSKCYKPHRCYYVVLQRRLLIASSNREINLDWSFSLPQMFHYLVEFWLAVAQATQ